MSSIQCLSCGVRHLEVFRPSQPSSTRLLPRIGLVKVDETTNQKGVVVGKTVYLGHHPSVFERTTSAVERPKEAGAPLKIESEKLFYFAPTESERKRETERETETQRERETEQTDKQRERQRVSLGVFSTSHSSFKTWGVTAQLLSSSPLSWMQKTGSRSHDGSCVLSRLHRQVSLSAERGFEYWVDRAMCLRLSLLLV